MGAKHDIHEMMEVCLLAGQLMLKNGAETYRVEDTMARMAEGFYFNKIHVYVTPTAIIFSAVENARGIEETKFLRITNRTNDLHKVALVNDISRKINQDQLSLEEAKGALEAVETSPLTFPVWLQIISAALVSGCFTLMFNGTWDDFFPAMLAGGLGFAAFKGLLKFIDVNFFSEMLASFVIGLVATLTVVLGMGKELDKIIIGAVMPLVPGVLITNAVRDLMAGHLVSGLSRGAEAFLTATAIGVGIAAVIGWF